MQGRVLIESFEQCFAGVTRIVLLVTLTLLCSCHDSTNSLEPADSLGNWCVYDGDASGRRFADAESIRRPYLKWHFDICTKDKISEPLPLGSKYVSVCTSGGKLLILDAATGQLAYTVKLYSWMTADEFRVPWHAIASNYDIAVSFNNKSMDSYSITHTGKCSKSFDSLCYDFQPLPDSTNTSSLSNLSSTLSECSSLELLQFEDYAYVAGNVKALRCNNDGQYVYWTWDNRFVFGSLIEGDTFRSRKFRGYGLVELMALDEQVIISSSKGTVSSLDYNGNSLWTHSVSDNRSGPRCIAANCESYIYYATRGFVVKLSPAGEELWSTKVSDSLDFTLSIVNNDNIVITDYDMIVYQLNCDTGDIEWQYKVTDKLSYMEVSIGEDGTIYLAAHKDGVYAISDK